MAVTTPTRGLASFAEHEMAQHLADEVLKDRFLYSAPFGWMQWDGKRWVRQEDREGIAVKRAFRRYLKAWVEKEVTRLLPTQTAALVGYLKIAGLERLERAVKTIGGVTVEGAWFDREPLLLNTPSGVLDLLDGSLNPHEPFYGMTKITAADYRPGATHPDWDKALEALPDDDTRHWLQCYLGRGVLGTQGGVEVTVFAIGGGANGKSLIFGAALEAVGTYGGIVADEVLAGRTHEEHMMDLRAMRFGLIEELADGHRVNVNRLKKILGTKRMKGRHLFQKPMEWEPCHTMVVTTNYTPIVTETDHGAWRRLLAVPFPFEFPLDPEYKERCYSDPDIQAAVLAWLVEGAMTPMPTLPSDAIQERTAIWRQTTDLVAQFVDECLHADPAGTVTRADMLDRFNEFIGRQGHKPMSGRTFTERFKSHPSVQALDIEEGKTGGVRNWKGVSLKAPSLRGVA